MQVMLRPEINTPFLYVNTLVSLSCGIPMSLIFLLCKNYFSLTKKEYEPFIFCGVFDIGDNCAYILSSIAI